MQNDKVFLHNPVYNPRLLEYGVTGRGGLGNLSTPHVDRKISHRLMRLFTGQSAKVSVPSQVGVKI